MKKTSSVWLGLVFTFLSIIVPIGIAFWEFTTNELTVELISTDSLISDTEQVAGLKVFFDEKLVESPKLVKLQIKNTGTEPISKSDFDMPLQLEFDSGVTIIKASITSTLPTSIPAEVSFDRKSLKLKPLLLNSEDNINISMVVSGEISSLKVLGRITNIKKIDLIMYKNEDNKVYKSALVIVSGAFLSFVYVYFAYASILLKAVTIPRWVGLFSALSAAIGSSFLIKKGLPYYSDNMSSILSTTNLPMLIFGGGLFVFLKYRERN
ncbi:hypothetical protein L0990_01450 [Vibrio kanaloae]|uniref:hypothetical protein n=1 Tax=Vibrio TaxID=662 RepID=UPI0022CDBC64|nr:hypothetical protein [Vibrio sp. RW]MDA0146042.1 hypothetical protein [Vibrio sp. RW]